MKRKRKRRSSLMHDATFTVVDIDTITPHPDNPRQGDIGAIYESIVENGFYGAIVVQTNSRHIIVGNHRWAAAKDAGIKMIPVISIDVDDDRARRIMLTDNRTAQKASWDESALLDFLLRIENETGDIDGTGFDGDDIDFLRSIVNPQESEMVHDDNITCPKCGYMFRKGEIS